jgi:DNA-binding transcriptional LysR family regulator
VPQKPADLLHHECICIRRSHTGERWAWELERGKEVYRVPVHGPVTTNDAELMRLLARAGVGLLYGLEDRIAGDIASGALRVVLAPYAAAVPGLFLYFPSRAQVSPALKALVAFVRTMRVEKT